MQASRTKSPSSVIKCILPKPGSHRRAVYDSVIADFPDVAPPYLLHRMNVHKDDAVKVIDELFGGGYPLAQGGFQVRVDPPTEVLVEEEDSSKPGLKHHVECQCCLEEVPLSQVGESGDANHVAVPRPLLDKLDDLQLQVSLDQADLADLEKCP